MLHSGRARIVAGNRDFLLEPGTMALWPTSIPNEWQILEQYACASIKLPRTMVETLLRPGNFVAPAQFSVTDPVMRMLASYVSSYLSEFDGLTAEAGQLAGRHMADLVALAIGASRDAEAEIAEAGGLKAARIGAILQAISTHSRSPFFSPASVGAQLGISERHVHRLLEETNRTFYEHLLEARLSHAYRMLTDPRSAGSTIADVADQCGFANLSYFSRAFRTRFGDTPSGVRASRNTNQATTTRPLL